MYTYTYIYVQMYICICTYVYLYKYAYVCKDTHIINLTLYTISVETWDVRLKVLLSCFSNYKMTLNSMWKTFKPICC